MTLNLDKNLNKFCQMLYIKRKNIKQSPVDQPWTIFFNKLIILLNIFKNNTSRSLWTDKGKFSSSSFISLTVRFILKLRLLRQRIRELIWKWHLKFHHSRVQYWVVHLKLNVSAYGFKLGWLRVHNSKISALNFKI